MKRLAVFLPLAFIACGPSAHPTQGGIVRSLEKSSSSTDSGIAETLNRLDRIETLIRDIQTERAQSLGGMKAFKTCIDRCDVIPTYYNGNERTDEQNASNQLSRDCFKRCEPIRPLEYGGGC